MREKNKSLLITAMACLLVIVCFTYFRIDTSPDNKKSEIEEKPDAPKVKRVSEESEVYVPTKYTVILEENRLNFYMIVDTKQVILESAEISEKLYPFDDIETLKAGVDIEKLEDGISLMEDFTS